jgi:hypothetical protein
LLVGKPPFEGTTPVVLMHSHLNEPPPRPSARVQEIPKALDELIVNLMAKSPSDRPWDAAVVGMKLGELRDKVSAGGHIAMVWPKQTPGEKPARAASKGAAADGASAADSRGTTARKKKTRKTRTLFGISPRDQTEIASSSWLNRSVLETGMLVAALVAIGGFIAYWLWPPSADYLYRKAETLMASSRRSDWRAASEDYMRELDDRFPDHPYRQKLREWRDKILLEDAENRGVNLASGLNINLTKPSTDAERKFVVTNGVAAAASERGDDLAAMTQWYQMAEGLKDAAKPLPRDDPDERQWYLLALHRVEQLQNAIKDRREFVEKQIGLASAADRAGRPADGDTIRRKLYEQFGKYTDLADIFPSPAPTRGEVGTPPAPASTAPSAESDAATPPKTAGEPKDKNAEQESKGEPEPAPKGDAPPRQPDSKSGKDDPEPENVTPPR